jgi:DNA-binding PadR family transcriptional regulator
MSLRAALLGLLAEAPATGYALIKEFAVSTSVIWPAPRGEIYRELARLEADGLARRDAKAGARGQRTWHITAKGRSELKRWLTAPSDYTLRYEPMLRAVFLSALAPGDIRKVVTADRAFFAAELAQLRKNKSESNPNRRYALPLAIAFYETMLAWCDKTEVLARKG